MSEETIEVVTEEKVDEKWSQEKQRADQAEANFRKAAKEKDEIALSLSERDTKLASLEQKLADLAEAQEVPVEDLLDPDLVDAKTIKTVSVMAKQIRDQKKAIDKLTSLADSFREKSKTQEIKSEKEKTIEKILNPLDKEFGAKFRNAARKMADSLVDEGKESQPKDVIEAMTLMRQCYVKVKSEADAKTEKKVTQTDNGSSSFSMDASIPKSGTRRDIMTQMKKKGLNLFGKS